MKFPILALSMACVGFVSVASNASSDQAFDMADGDAAYYRFPVEYLPPIIREHPYKVVQRVPVIQKVIDVARPVIEKVKVPIIVRERRLAPAVVGAPGAPAPQDGGDQGPPQQGGPGGDQGGQPQFQGQGPSGPNGQPQFGGRGGQHPQFQGGQMGQMQQGGN